MTISRILSISLVAGGSLLAQANNDIGFTRGWTTSYTDRVGATNVVADVMNHFDERNYQDWMLDPADTTGATYKLLGVRFVIQDQIGNTPESYDVVAYNEDATNPNFPDTTTPTGIWFRSGVLNMPASTLTTPVAWIVTVTLPAATPSAPKGDKWVGLNLSPPTTGSWPTDGASLHCAFDRAVNSTLAATTDQAGPRIDTVPNGQFACYVPVTAGLPTGSAVYPAGNVGLRRQIRLEVIANVTGGVCVTQTNQTNYTSSNPGAAGSTPLGGTTNFISGLHPDVYDGNVSTNPRNDDIGFLVSDVNLPNAPVFILLATGPSPVGSTPLPLLAPGVLNPSTTRGNVCIDFVNAVTFVGFSNSAGLYQHMLTLSPAVRLAIQGLSAPGASFDLWYQGFVLNAVGGFPYEVRATGCGIQHL